MRMKIQSPIWGAIRIIGFYLLIGFLWILFSDNLVAFFAPNEDVFRELSIYKGWGYVLVTGILLYILIKNHTDRISANETRLLMAYDAADLGTWQHDHATGLFRVDERARIQHGFDKDGYETPFEDVLAQVHPDDVVRLKQEIARASHPSDGGSYSSEFRFIHADGSIHWLEVKAYVSFEGAGEKRRSVLGVGTSRDITASKRADLQIHYFARLYATLSQVNQTIVRCHDRQELFDSICRLAVEFGEFRLAWVGLLDKETGMLTPVAEYGFQENKLPFHKIDPRKMPFRDDLLGLALRSGRVEISNDIQVEPHLTHWREIAVRDQYHSAAAMPIRQNAQVIGLLNLYAADSDFFMVMEEQKLLEEMSLDISFALDAMQTEKQREQAMKSALESEERFQKVFYSVPVGLAITRGSDGVYTDVNHAFTEITGFSREELIGQTSLGLSITTPVQRQEYTSLIKEQGYINDREMILRSKSGGARVVLGSMEIIELNHEACVLSTAIDITERKQAEEALRKSEHRWTSLVKTISDYIALFDKEGRYLFLNHYSEGYSEKNVLGRQSVEFITDESKPEYLRVFENAIHTGLTHFVEYYGYGDNGSVRYYDGYFAPIIENGQFVYMLALARDITDRKAAEESLRESEQRFLMLANHIEEVFWIFDPVEKKQVYISPAFEKIWARPVQDFFDDPDEFFENIIPEDRAHVRSVTDRQARGEKTEMQYRICRPDGSIRWIWDRDFPVFDEDGNVKYVVAILADISEQKQAEMDLIELNQNLEQRVKERTAEVQDLYENSPSGYHSLDANGVIVRINQTELNWLGYSRKEIVGVKSIRDLFTVESQKTFDQNFPHFKAQGWIKDLEFEMIRKDGSTFPILLNSTVIYNENGDFLMTRSTLFDITERKQAELKLQAANGALEKAAKLKDEFLANMSHELRTPLNAIIGLGESLQANVYGELNPRQGKIVDVMRESGNHLLELINDILDLSKIEAGMMELQYETIDLKTICEASMLMVNEPALKKELRLSVSITDKIQTIQADQRRLKQMIVNLLSNAVKFTPQFGSVGLEVLPENDHAIRFTVWDTGIGIPNEQLEKLFKPFVQVDSSLARKYEGTGLGLALVRQLAEMHNGSIGVESAPEKGSSFYFIIPKQSLQYFVDVEAALSYEMPLEQLSIPSSSVTILLVEDNPMNLMFTGDYLTAKGYHLITAENGLQAIEQVSKHKPNLILMDIQMPELDGIETIRRLRSAPEHAAVPIIAVTALAMPGDRERCLEAGANEYLAKPVSLKKLVEMINRFLK